MGCLGPPRVRIQRPRDPEITVIKPPTLLLRPVVVEKENLSESSMSEIQDYFFFKTEEKSTKDIIILYIFC